VSPDVCAEMDASPDVGDVWSWPDGRLSILTTLDIARGYVTTRAFGRDINHRIADGRRRDEPHIIATAFDMYGVSE